MATRRTVKQVRCLLRETQCDQAKALTVDITAARRSGIYIPFVVMQITAKKSVEIRAGWNSESFSVRNPTVYFREARMWGVSFSSEE